MRNLKKFLAVLVVVAIMATAMVPVIAAGATKTDAEICKDLSVLKGEASGVTADYLAKATTRLQAATIYLRLKGLEPEALAYQGTANFADGNIAYAGGKAIMAYLKANPDLGWLGDGVNFKPNDLCTVQMFYKVLLEGLGYKQGVDFEWAEVIGFAKANNLKKIAVVTKFTNNDMAVALVEALVAKMKSGSTLITKLVADKVIDSADAAASGLLTAAGITSVGNVDLGKAAVGAAVTLPATVQATLSDSSKADVAVTWTPAAVDTTKVGTFTFKGAIEGYAAGITATVTVEAAALAFTSATAINLKEIVVVFNKELDEDTVIPANFKIGANNAGAVALADDNKTVTVTVATLDLCANGASYDLTVKTSVKGTDGVALAADQKATVTAFDVSKPVISKMELTGPATIKLTFSEPIKTKGTVKLNNGIYSVSVPVADETNVSTLTINAGSLADGNYSVAISAFTDFANFAMDAVTMTLAYAKVTTPIAASIKADPKQDEVTVVFNRKVTLKAGDEINYFYHTFTAWVPNAVATTDGIEYKLTLTTYPVPEGTANLIVNYDGSADTPIKDEWGNELAANLTLKVTVAADVTAPSVTAIESTDEDKVKLTFSEALDEAIAETVANYVVKDSTGATVGTAFTATYDNTDSVYTIVLDFASDLDAGTYNVVISKIQDSCTLSDNVMSDTTKSFTITDQTQIVVADTAVTDVLGAGTDNEVIYVTYPEKMTATGQYSVLSASNYLIDLDGAGIGLPAELDDDATLEMFGTSGKIVKISIPDLAIVNGTTTLVIGRVADTSGNATVELSYTEVMGAETAPAIATVEQTDYNKLVVTFDKILSDVSADAFKQTVGAEVYEISGIATALNEDGDATIVTLTLSGEFVDYEVSQVATYKTDTSKKVTQVEMVGANVIAETGMAAVDATVLNAAIVDKRVPELVADSEVYTNLANSTIALTYTEALAAGNQTLYAFDYVVKDGDGKALVPAVGYTTAVAGAVLTITIPSVANIDAYTVESVATPVYIQDASANIAKGFTT
jgi:hypothetical protein